MISDISSDDLVMDWAGGSGLGTKAEDRVDDRIEEGFDWALSGEKGVDGNALVGGAEGGRSRNDSDRVLPEDDNGG